MDSWRVTLFALYGLFFSLSSIVRARNFGSLAAKQADRQWATPASRAAQVRGRGEGEGEGERVEAE